VDWQTRTNSIEQIRKLIDKVSSLKKSSEPDLQTDTDKTVVKAVLSMFSQMQMPLIAQLLDLRSSVTKETINTLVHLAERYPNEFGLNCTKYFRENEGFFKLLQNGKRLFSDMAHAAITEILTVVCVPK